VGSLFTGSIVLFNNEASILNKAIQSFLNATPYGILYLIDNSPTDDLKKIATNDRVIYISNPSNPGFGASHNKAIDLAKTKNSKWHFIINPDTHFEGDVITPMIRFMEEHPNVGMMMPQVLNNDGTIQFLPKLLPNILWIIRRKLHKLDPRHQNFISKYELRIVPEDKIYNSPLLSGCFNLMRLEAIEKVGGYDDNFFMYFEDFDLSRRMHAQYQTIYFPKVAVYHGYEGGANKNLKLFRIFITSGFIYFNKWGWIFDKQRKKINKKTLEQFGK